MGSSFNLSPIIILLNLALWGYIWQIPGMFLCVPFLIIVTIILSHFPQTRAIAIILSSDGKLQIPLDPEMRSFSFGGAASTLLESDQESSSE
jgi:AI-2 transport protein TqsA